MTAGEETLDPQDWEALRRLAHRMVDDLIRLHRDVGKRPAWQPLGAATDERLRQELPQDGTGLTPTYEAFLRDIEPFTLGNRHPRGWGWVNGTGSTVGALAELLVAGMNTNAWGGHQASTVVETQVIEWTREVLGLPAGGSTPPTASAVCSSAIPSTTGGRSPHRPHISAVSRGGWPPRR